MQVVINEVQAVNSSTITHSQGNTPDWVELYNPTPNTVSLQVSSATFCQLCDWLHAKLQEKKSLRHSCSGAVYGGPNIKTKLQGGPEISLLNRCSLTS